MCFILVASLKCNANFVMLAQQSPLYFILQPGLSSFTENIDLIRGMQIALSLKVPFL